jgi:uncharacterized membrane protein
MDTSRRVYVSSLAAVALWCALILAAPLSRLAELPPVVPSVLYEAFSHVCHQFPDRTLLLGSEPLGVCARCTAIYFSFLATMVVIFFFKKSEGRAPARWVLLVAAGPMVFDVALAAAGIHASTMGTRILTGILLGAVLPLYLFPPFLEAVRQLMIRYGDSLNAKQAG